MLFTSDKLVFLNEIGIECTERPIEFRNPARAKKGNAFRDNLFISANKRQSQDCLFAFYGGGDLNEYAGGARVSRAKQLSVVLRQRQAVVS